MGERTGEVLAEDRMPGALRAEVGALAATLRELGVGPGVSWSLSCW